MAEPKQNITFRFDEKSDSVFKLFALGYNDFRTLGFLCILSATAKAPLLSATKNTACVRGIIFLFLPILRLHTIGTEKIHGVITGSHFPQIHFLTAKSF